MDNVIKLLSRCVFLNKLSSPISNLVYWAMNGWIGLLGIFFGRPLSSLLERCPVTRLPMDGVQRSQQAWEYEFQLCCSLATGSVFSSVR